MQVTGDLGGITYVQRGGNRRTSYIKAWPSRPASFAQKQSRARFSSAVAFWHTVADVDRDTLDLIAHKYHMILSGYNLLISCRMNERNSWLTQWAISVDMVWPYNDDWTHI